MHRLDHAAELLTAFNVLDLDGRPLGDVGLITRRSVVSVAVWPIGVVQPRNQTPMIPRLWFSIRGIPGSANKWSLIKSGNGVIEQCFVAVW